MIKANFNRIFILLVLCLVLTGMFLPFTHADALEEIELEVGIGDATTATSITGYIKQIYLFATGIVAGLAAVMIVIGGIKYSTAAGNPKGIASAKETIISAIIGLVIVALAYLILGLFGTQFTDLKEPALDPVEVAETKNLPHVPVSEWCEENERPFNDANACETYCQREYNRNCTTRHKGGQSAQEQVYCCNQEAADPDTQRCENQCWEASSCFQNEKCWKVYGNYCTAMGYSPQDDVPNPDYDIGECNTAKQRAYQLCQNAGCGAWDFAFGPKGDHQICCTAP